MLQTNFSNPGAPGFIAAMPSEYAGEMAHLFELDCGGVQFNGVKDAGVAQGAILLVTAGLGTKDLIAVEISPLAVESSTARLHLRLLNNPIDEAQT